MSIDEAGHLISLLFVLVLLLGPYRVVWSGGHDAHGRGAGAGQRERVERGHEELGGAVPN
jgi:hypothetical protein